MTQRRGREGARGALPPGRPLLSLQARHGLPRGPAAGAAQKYIIPELKMLLLSFDSGIMLVPSAVSRM